MGTTMDPTMSSTRSPTVDEIPLTCHHHGGPNQKHSLCQTMSNAMVRRLWIYHWGIQIQWTSMEMDNPLTMAWETHIEPPIIHSISSDHIYYHPANGKGVTHLSIHRQFQSTWLDAQSILWSSERIISRCSSTLAWMDTRQSQDIPILTTYQRNRKHHQGFPLKGFP